MTHRLFMKDYVTRAAMTLLLALMTTASAWADDTFEDKDAIVVTTSDGGTASVTSCNSVGVCDYFKVVLKVTPAHGYYTNLNKIKAGHQTDNTITYDVVYDSQNNCVSSDPAYTTASLNYSSERELTLYFGAANANTLKINVDFSKDELKLENGLSTIANVKFYTSASEPTTTFISGITSTTAQATKASPGDYVVMYIEPTAGLWTNAALLYGQDNLQVVTARHRLRSSDPSSTPTPNIVTLLQAAEGKYNGEGWYYYQIPADHSCFTGYDQSMLSGNLVNKFDLSTISKNDVTINSNTGVATATLTAYNHTDDFPFTATLTLNTSFTFDGTTASIVPTFSGTIGVVGVLDENNYNIQLTPSEQIEVTNSSLSYTATTVTGTVELKATTTGCFTGTKSGSESIPFTINKKKVTTGDGSSTSSDATLTIEVEDKEFVYNGAAHTPTITVKDGTTTLAQGADKDFTVSYSNNVDAGEATITLKSVSTSFYDVSGTAKFTISPKPLTATVTADNKPYDGSETATVAATVTTGITGQTLAIGGLTGTFAKKDAGTGITVTVDATKATVTPRETTTKATNYDITYPTATAANITPLEVTLAWTPSPATFTYSQNKAQAPTATAGGLISGDECEVTVEINAKRGSSLTDGKAVNAGNYFATALSLSNKNYKLPANASCDFTITAIQGTIGNGNGGGGANGFTLLLGGLANFKSQYTGEVITPPATLIDGNGNPIPQAEYGVDYSNNVNVGTAQVTISDNPGGNYNVSGVANFEITPADLAITAKPASKEYGQKDPELPYDYEVTSNNEILTPAFKKFLRLQGALSRVAGEDVGEYDIKQGTLKVAQSSAKNFNVSFTGAKFKITPKPASNSNMNGLTVTKTYKDGEQVPILTVKDGNNTLKEGTDYTLSYKDKDGKPVTKDKMEENPGEYVAVITLIGNYTGEITEDIIVKSLGITITPKNDWFTFSNDVDVTLPDGLTAYTCLLDPSGQSIAVLYYLIPDDKLKVNNQRVVKGGNGILLHGKAGTKYMFKFASETPVNDVKQDYGTTQLIPVVKPTHFKKGDIYVLNSNQFFPITESSTEVPANRAVLKLPAGATAARVLMLVDSGTTGVSEELRVNSEEFATAQWYTLDGRKLDAMPTKKGVYIMNGRKVVIK